MRINSTKVGISLLATLFFHFTTWASDGSHIQPQNMYPKVEMQTSMGNVIIELDRDRAPITVNNFLRYVEKRAFEGIIFHRVIPGFVVQGGGYNKEFKHQSTFAPIINESGNGLKNDMYTIAMAKQTDDPHSATREFFFNMADNKTLNPGRKWGYAVFGYVTEGADILEEINAVETHVNIENGWPDVPVTPVTIDKVKILPAEDN